MRSWENRRGCWQVATWRGEGVSSAADGGARREAAHVAVKGARPRAR